MHGAAGITNPHFPANFFLDEIRPVIGQREGIAPPFEILPRQRCSDLIGRVLTGADDIDSLLHQFIFGIVHCWAFRAGIHPLINNI